MFELNQDFKVSPTKVILLEADGRALRRVRFKLECDFGGALAVDIGGVAPTALELVADRGVTKVVIPLDAVHGEMVLEPDPSDDEKVTMPVDGFKASAIAPKVPKNENEDFASPTLKLEFDTAMEPKLWAFLGRHAGDVVRVVYRDHQLSLPLGKNGGEKKPPPPPAPEKPTRGRRARAKKQPDAAARTSSEDPRTTAQRHREEKAEDDGVWKDGGADGLAF